MTVLVPDLPTVETTIIEQTNTFRKAQGLAGLRTDRILTAAARAYATYLAKSGRFSHTADGRQPHERTVAAGYRHCQIGENLAYNLDSRGFTTRDLASRMVGGWKKSPGHRRNMVMPHATEIGVGLARAPGEQKYYAVQLFGRPETQKYVFKVVNRTTETLRYALSSSAKGVEIVPRMTVTHTVCTPVSIRFERPGGFLSQSQSIGRFDAQGGDVFTIQTTAGRIAVSRGTDGTPNPVRKPGSR